VIRRLVSVLLICVVASSASVPPSAADTMARFCFLDAQGARTDSRLPASKKIDDLNLWEAEPGWDTVTVISSYRIKTFHQSSKKAEVVVEYKTEGTWAITEWEDLNKTEVVHFELEYSGQHWSFPANAEPVLVKARPQWRIIEPVLQPHVSVTWALARMKRQIEREKDQQDKDKELKILHRLETIAKSHPARL